MASLSFLRRLHLVVLAVLASCVLAGALVIGWAWQSVTWYPQVSEVTPGCDVPARPWDPARPLKVLSFNVQYMAGKNYVFFYDMEGGPDSRPSLADTELTLDRVAAILADENPDIVLLQEINDQHDSRTHFIDQLQALQQRLGEQAYPCQAGAHYWQAGLVLHPKILGAVSMQLVTLSRFPIIEARRHQLPLMDNDPLTRRFYFQRALLETHMATRSGPPLAVFNTHFDAWGEGDLMQRQVDTTLEQLQALDERDIPWILGGDLNLLPHDDNRQRQRLYGGSDTVAGQVPPIAELYQRYGAIPAREQLLGPTPDHWYTYFPNNPDISAPDRTIDYLFYSAQWQLQEARLRRHDTLDVSDHLPVVGVFRLPSAARHSEQDSAGR